MTHRLARLAKVVTDLASTPWALAGAFVVVATWFVGGAFVKQHFANTNYQLLINTGTTIVTFWLGFAILVQAKRETAALMLKLDELIESLPDADDGFVDLEDGTDEDLKQAKAKIKQRANRKATQ